jgi:hypothetical protein
VHFRNFWKNQTGGGPLFAATQRCFNAIHLAAASPCHCLACMPRCFKIFFPHQTLSSFCSLRLLIFLLLQHVRQAEPSRRCCFCSSLYFAVAATLLCCFVACLSLLLLLCCVVVPLFASRQCCCRRRVGATPAIPSCGQGRAPTPAEQHPLHRPSPPHSSSSCASPLPSSSELEHCNATSFLPWSSTMQLSSPSCTPATSPGVVAVMTHELPTSANL